MKAQGILKVDEKKKRVVVDLSWDFSKYYLWFIKKELWISLDTPRHMPHITLTHSGVHGKVDLKKLKVHHGKTIYFEYDPYLIRGGSKKGFVMYYVSVYSKELEEYKRIAKIDDGPEYRGLHITIGNAKGGLRSYWPELITIKK